VSAASPSSFFLAARHSVVVAGTHGKTTTSSLLGHVLTHAGRDPSFLVGGVTQNYAGNFRMGQGPHFVLEGDEYDTAYFDKGPKFLHYRPRTLVLTSVELDHADIYRDLQHYESAFERLLSIVPADGTVLVSASWPRAVELARGGRAQVVTYSAREGVSADYAARGLELGAHGARFQVLERGAELGSIALPMAGTHNVENALGVFGAARALGLSAQEIAGGLLSFQGVKRRQEVRGEPGGVLVLDDFAHHPTAVRETIAAVASTYPGRRLWAVFEPRSNTSRRNLHQREYEGAFGRASRVSIKVPDPHDQIPAGEELDATRIAQALRQGGLPASSPATVDELLDEVATEARPGDVVLVSGSMGDHGVAIMSTREGLSFETTIESDSAALHGLVAEMVKAVPDIHVLRDPTRGGLATTLNEIAHQSGVGFELEERAIPVKPQVAAACELLGIDPLYVANEGKLIAICASADAEKLLAIMRQHPLGRDAAVVGRVTDDEHRFLELKTAFGGSRILEWLAGEQLPRIC